MCATSKKRTLIMISAGKLYRGPPNSTQPQKCADCASPKRTTLFSRRVGPTWTKGMSCSVSASINGNPSYPKKLPEYYMKLIMWTFKLNFPFHFSNYSKYFVIIVSLADESWYPTVLIWNKFVQEIHLPLWLVETCVYSF